MNTTPFRAIALDLDGTLTNSDKIVTPRTREALMRAQADGIHIILASGRPTYGIVPIAQVLDLDKNGGFILSYNGGNIVDAKTGEVLFSQNLPEDVLPILHNYAREHKYALLGYRGNTIVTEIADDEYVREEARINKMPVEQVDNILDHVGTHPTKLLMTGHPDNMAVADKELKDILGDRMEIYRSAPFFVELVPQGIDKAQSLLRLLERLNLTKDNLIAFGDGWNDLSMLKLAAVGVAMSNAAEEIKSQADYVTLSNDEDGVAIALDNLLYANV